MDHWVDDPNPNSSPFTLLKGSPKKYVARGNLWVSILCKALVYANRRPGGPVANLV